MGRVATVPPPPRAEVQLARWMVLPAVLLVLAVTVAPLAYALFLSLTKSTVVAGGIKWSWVWFKNYAALLRNTGFWQSVRVTSLFTFASLSIELALGIGMALVLNLPFRGRGLVRSLVLLPWAVPTVVNARMWAWILDGHGYGALNGLLQSAGVIREPVVWLGTATPFAGIPFLDSTLAWLGDSRALNMIILADTWKVTPVVILLALAGLQTIPKEMYEAAEVDGASAWRQFWTITLPMLRPVLLVILVLRTMELFRVFDILYIVMANTIKVLSILTFEEGIVFGNVGRGAALSFIIALLILLVALVYMRLLEPGGED